MSIDGVDLRVVFDAGVSDADGRLGLGLDCGTGVDDSADEASPAGGLSFPLPFFFFLDFLDKDAGFSSDAIDSASNWPGKTVGKGTTIAAGLAFDDVSASAEVDFLEFFFLAFLFAIDGVGLVGCV
jgi:hypothetical protein